MLKKYDFSAVENSYFKNKYFEGVFQKKKYQPTILKMHRPQQNRVFEWVDFYAVDQINTNYIGIFERIVAYCSATFI